MYAVGLEWKISKNYFKSISNAHTVLRNLKHIFPFVYVLSTFVAKKFKEKKLKRDKKKKHKWNKTHIDMSFKIYLISFTDVGIVVYSK